AGAVMALLVEPDSEGGAVVPRDLDEAGDVRSGVDQPVGEPPEAGLQVLDRSGPVELAAGLEIAVERLRHLRREDSATGGQREGLPRKFGKLTGVEQQQLEEEQLRTPVPSLARPGVVPAVEPLPVRVATEAADGVGEAGELIHRHGRDAGDAGVEHDS